MQSANCSVSVQVLGTECLFHYSKSVNELGCSGGNIRKVSFSKGRDSKPKCRVFLHVRKLGNTDLRTPSKGQLTIQEHLARLFQL